MALTSDTARKGASEDRMKLYTKDGRAELLNCSHNAQGYVTVLKDTPTALLYESATPHSARQLARQFCVDHKGETIGRFLTLSEAFDAFKALR